MLFTGDSEEEATLVIDDEMEVTQSNQPSDNEYVYTELFTKIISPYIVMLNMYFL